MVRSVKSNSSIASDDRNYSAARFLAADVGVTVGFPVLPTQQVFSTACWVSHCAGEGNQKAAVRHAGHESLTVLVP
jgi:hypothetical protein